MHAFLPASTLICRGQRLFVVVGADKHARCGVFDLIANSYLWMKNVLPRVDVWDYSPDSTRLVGLNWESGQVWVYSAISGLLESQFETLGDAEVKCNSTGLIVASNSLVCHFDYHGELKQESSVQGKVAGIWSSLLMTEWKKRYQLFDLNFNLLGRIEKSGLGVVRGTIAESDSLIMFGESRGNVRSVEKKSASIQWEFVPPQGWHATFLATSGNRTYAICPELATMTTAKLFELDGNGNCVRESCSEYRGLFCYCEAINCWITNRLEVVNCSTDSEWDSKRVDSALQLVLQK
jgi:hypothetical protein